MTIFKRGASLLALLLSAVITKADTLTILAMHETGATTSTAQMVAIPPVFANTPGLGGISITLVNGGASTPLSSTLSGATDEQKRQSATNHSQLREMRDYYSADLVVVFTNSLSANTCGHSGLPSAHNWTGTGAALIGNPDLRQSEVYFISLVTLAGDCSTWARLAAHEVGHLFGAGHEEGAIVNPFHGLFTDSYADFVQPGYGTAKFTITAATYPPFPCVNNCQEI